MKKFKVPLLAGLVFLLLPSCATIFLGSHQNVTVQSDPPGAELYVNGKNTYQKTPTTVSVKRRVAASQNNRQNEQVYVLRKEGYHETEYHDMSTFHWLAGVDFLYYVVPGLVDVAVGANRKYQDQVFVKMSPVGGTVIQERLVTKVDTVVQQQIVYVPAGGAGQPAYLFQKNSDVDKNIPVSPRQYTHRYALIIGNEDYSSHQLDLSSEVNVDFARNDASAFNEYAQSVLGIPEENIIFMLDATTGRMRQGIDKASKIIKATNGKAEFFVYYAGHGLPDEQTKEPFIMPVDVSGKNAYDGIALKDMYAQLTEFPSKRVTVFIDACFSGGARNQGLLAARGVKINPKESPLGGNLVVFSASSSEQSSLPYKQQEHGMFTYYLLKKMQQSKGDVSYKQLSDFVIENVSLRSVLINDKEQNPKVSTSSGSQSQWSNWKLNE
jgi:hypothetical protein